MEVNVVDKEGHSPLHCAVENRCEGLVAWLLAARADGELRDSRGRSALGVACEGEACGVVKRLLEARATAVGDHFGRRPLHCAAEKGHEELMRLLLEAKHGLEEGQRPWKWPRNGPSMAI